MDAIPVSCEESLHGMARSHALPIVVRSGQDRRLFRDLFLEIVPKVARCATHAPIVHGRRRRLVSIHGDALDFFHKVISRCTVKGT